MFRKGADRNWTAVLSLTVVCCFTLPMSLVPAQAQTETVLYSFTGGSDGANPYWAVVLDKEGNVYGTNVSGGATGIGNVFKLTPSGAFSNFYSFTGASDGADPNGDLAIDSIGNIYGTTVFTVFEVSPSGAETTLLTFESSPDAKGNLYGTTQEFGPTGSIGTLFEVTKPYTGNADVLYDFTATSELGNFPYGNLTRSSAGNLYGTTQFGAAYGWGSLFKVTPSGTGTVLHAFAANGVEWILSQSSDL